MRHRLAVVTAGTSGSGSGPVRESAHRAGRRPGSAPPGGRLRRRRPPTTGGIDQPLGHFADVGVDAHRHRLRLGEQVAEPVSPGLISSWSSGRSPTRTLVVDQGDRIEPVQRSS